MRLLLLFCFFILSINVFAQKSIDVLLSHYNTRSVPYISVQELRMQPDKYLILDTRKREEFDVSHIPGAIWVGEKTHENQLKSLISNKNQPIIVYCTVGIRSEDFGKKMEKMNFAPINNLYGGIFAWKDAGFPVIDSTGNKTERVHIFARHWGKYLETRTKVY
ncbi:rhodanese-like domain-containing protein [Leeuwenhoekiella sp. A16]|uniref:rhodanese-like domain-containing protein n=1 Tax=unclassified Leeuwenhoekiella TaxID=2615029 RepID=UPI003A800999